MALNELQMKIKLVILLLLLAISHQSLLAQKTSANKNGHFSFNVNFSDYSFSKLAKDSSLAKAFSEINLLKSGKSAFGFGVSYHRSLAQKIGFTGNLGGTFSNFPAHFVKDDSIGQAGFSAYLDALIHLKALKAASTINPFLTAGAGIGYFGSQIAAYAPLGVGLQFNTSKTSYILVQAQWRLALTTGITNDYLFYSLGFASHPIIKKEEKKKAKKPAIPVSSEDKKEKNISLKDTDGDGFDDEKDNCPNEKGTVNGCPDKDNDGIADKDDKCPDIKGTTKYNGCLVPDTDGDGVNDDNDKCITVPGLVRYQGCPIPDSDGDGINDEEDKCPNIAGYLKNQGCPMEVVEGAELISSSENEMSYSIHFDFDRAIITTEAFSILRDVVRVLKADPTLFIKISGHADSIGTNFANMQVSAERAAITKDYFMSYGISAKRITTTFYGATKPKDIHQQWLNRRVEISIYRK